MRNRDCLHPQTKLDDTVHHIYVDADDDPNTGREGYGVEYMLTVAGGYGRSSRFEKDGAAGQAPPIRFAVDGNTLLTSADVELGRDAQGARFRMWVLCHAATTADQPGNRMSSTTNRFLVEGVPLNSREKIMLPADYPEHHRVAGTFGLDVIRPLLTDPKVVAVRYDELEVDGFEVDLFTSQRYGHLKRLGAGARAWHEVTEPGRFFVGFLMYDDGSDQRVAIYVNDELAGVAAVSVRDFWRNYPKGFAVTAAGVQVDLCPAFEAGLYDAFPFEKEGHQLYYYLRDGTFTIKRGMAKTHELLLDFGAGAAERAVLFQRPLLLTAEPAWYCGSKAFYHVAPRDTEQFPAYEAAIDRNLAAYIASRERQRDYGMMNYGDWYGERGVNWGNIEYDTQHAFFLEYIRSANPDAFFLAEAAQVHNRDIDTVHWSPNPGEIGLVYVHQMGHVGGYYDESVPDTLGIPRAGASVSHAWTEGQFDHYFLTGDLRSLETGMAVVDYFTDYELSRPYDWTSARVPGWHLIMLASALAATNDPYYLNASRIVIDRVLETQDTEPRELPEYQKRPGRAHQLGGWTRMMVPGHCHCEPRHRGNAGFMVTILLTGMTYYHDVTQEPAVKDAIILGARYLIDEFYSTETHGFRYTSCPEMGYLSSPALNHRRPSLGEYRYSNRSPAHGNLRSLRRTLQEDADACAATKLRAQGLLVVG